MSRRRGLYAISAALVVSSLALSGCAADTGSAPTTPAAQSAVRAVDAPAPTEVRKWLDYDRPAEFENVQSIVSVPTRDGADLSCRLSQPGRAGKPDAGKHPGVVLEFTPYGKDIAPMVDGYLAERGYNVLVCDVRGTGESPGDYTSWFQAKEAEDNYDVIEWLAAQPGSTSVREIFAGFSAASSSPLAATDLPSRTSANRQLDCDSAVLDLVARCMRHPA